MESENDPVFETGSPLVGTGSIHDVLAGFYGVGTGSHVTNGI